MSIKQSFKNVLSEVFNKDANYKTAAIATLTGLGTGLLGETSLVHYAVVGTAAAQTIYNIGAAVKNEF